MENQCGVDLHMHSSCSDGSDTVPELLYNLRRTGIDLFSLTDHDTIRGIREMQRLVPKEMRFIPGIEFSCIAGSAKCHILGYGYDPENALFLETVREASELRYDKLTSRLEYLKETFQIRFNEKELDWLHRQSSPGRPHLAELLIGRGMASSISEAFETFLNQMPSPRIDAGKAIRAILSAGGLPVWAHPFGESPAERISEEEMYARLDTLTGLGIRGLECWYSQYTEDMIRTLLRAAQNRHLLVSGGSDYHGTRKKIALGTLGKGISPGSPKKELSVLRELGAVDADSVCSDTTGR